MTDAEARQIRADSRTEIVQGRVADGHTLTDAMSAAFETERLIGRALQRIQREDQGIEPVD